MKNILIINGWHEFAVSKGKFNKSLFDISKTHFSNDKLFKVKTTEINEPYLLSEDGKTGQIDHPIPV